MAAVMRPARNRKNAGELLQNVEDAYGLGRNDARYAATATTLPQPNSNRFTRFSLSSVRACSMTTPASPPANRKAAHGNSEKFDSHGTGRRYASTGSGRAFI